jgi:hypothetical protein
MTEDELIEKMARDLTRLELSAQRSPWRLHTNEILDFLVEKCWPDRAPNARAALAAIREAGCEVAPREPTEKMLEAGYPCFAGVACGDLALDIAGDAWHAMLSASPLKGET